jgi:hypothetical protein
MIEKIKEKVSLAKTMNRELQSPARLKNILRMLSPCRKPAVLNLPKTQRPHKKYDLKRVFDNIQKRRNETRLTSPTFTQRGTGKHI